MSPIYHRPALQVDTYDTLTRALIRQVQLIKSGHLAANVHVRQVGAAVFMVACFPRDEAGRVEEVPARRPVSRLRALIARLQGGGTK